MSAVRYVTGFTRIDAAQRPDNLREVECEVRLTPEIANLDRDQGLFASVMIKFRRLLVGRRHMTVGSSHTR